MPSTQCINFVDHLSFLATIFVTRKSKDVHRVQDDVILIFLNIYFNYSYNEYIYIEKYAYLFFNKKREC